MKKLEFESNDQKLEAPQTSANVSIPVATTIECGVPIHVTSLETKSDTPSNPDTK